VTTWATIFPSDGEISTKIFLKRIALREFYVKVVQSSLGHANRRTVMFGDDVRQKDVTFKVKADRFSVRTTLVEPDSHMLSFKSNLIASSLKPIQRFKPTVMRRRTHPLRATAAPTTDMSPWLARCLYPLSHGGLLPSYFHQIRVTGQHHLARPGAMIIAPTHRSRWDGLLVAYAAGQHITGCFPRYMVTLDEMQGVQGWLIRQMGGFPIDTRSPAVKSLRYGIELLQQQQVLVVFPEGGALLENRRSGLNRLHPGLARLAIQANIHDPHCDVAIVPMAINYGLPPGTPTIGRCDVDIQIGEPIVVSDYLTDSPKRSAKKITTDLSQAMRQLSHLPELVTVSL
jgi:1-acyl-sn-glycerol-3-phosphate acyltransferase